MTWTF